MVFAGGVNCHWHQLVSFAIVLVIMSKAPALQTSWRHIWHLSWPIMVANLSQPLVGAADTAMMGHLSDPALIGGVALGTVVIHFLIMIFGFLRMTTTALTSQALGAGGEDNSFVQRPLQRGLMIGAGFGMLFTLTSPFIASLSAVIMPASDGVETHMRAYVMVQIYALPAILMNAALLGWLYGLQSMRLGMIQLLLINGLNIVLNFVFVLGFDGGIHGVALASVVANWIGFAFVIFMIRQQFAPYLVGITSFARALSPSGWSAYGSLSRDIIIRTILLYLVQVSLLYAASIKGDIPLAALQIIVVIFSIIAYSLDGFAHASEALVGAAIGAKNKDGKTEDLKRIIWRSTALAGLFSVLFSLVLSISAMPLLSLLTSHQSVISQTYALWGYVLCLAPASFLAFQMDGIFIGAANGRALRNGMILSVSLFILLLVIFGRLPMTEGLDGVLLAFIFYLIARGLTLLMRLPEIFNTKANIS